jgi:hypothetical protein
MAKDAASDGRNFVGTSSALAASAFECCRGGLGLERVREYNSRGTPNIRGITLPAFAHYVPAPRIARSEDLPVLSHPAQ